MTEHTKTRVMKNELINHNAEMHKIININYDYLIFQNDKNNAIFFNDNDYKIFQIKYDETEYKITTYSHICDICNYDNIYFEKDVCKNCMLRTRHRVLKNVLLDNIFDNKIVCANYASPGEIKYFLLKASKLINFDIRPSLDVQANVEDLVCFSDNMFDVFYTVYVLNHVKNDVKALEEIRRVLKVGGLCVIMVPFKKNRNTINFNGDDLYQAYGKELFDKYSIGSYRYYGFDDFCELLKNYFEVTVLFGNSNMTHVENADAVFLCKNNK